MKARLLLFVALATMATAASSQTIANGGFETNNVGSSGYLYSTDGLVASPWTFTGTSGVSGNGTMWGSAKDGSYFAFIQSVGGSTPKFSQVVSGLQVGTSYTISFATKRRDGFDGNALYVRTSSDVLGHLTPGTSWATKSMSFVAAASSTTISFYTNGTTADTTSLVDSISLASVPEPATLAILGVGLVPLVKRRRGRK